MVISRALVAIFSHPVLRRSLAFRGGTALYKLFIRPPARYSEDIDLVQVQAAPAGPIMGALHEVLDPWLSPPRYKQSEGRVTFEYRFASEDPTPLRLKLKVEINTREHFTVHGIVAVPFRVSSRWFAGACEIRSYALDELLGTKLRALYQRRKGRDLFDLATALADGEASPERIVECFGAYMGHGGQTVSRAGFEANLAAKLRDRRFVADIGPLLARGRTWNLDAMAKSVSEALISRLPGEPWQGG
ncbi:nucleotidyl transferase AbiEii/AbiGii toxin family protein [Spiribacter halobius]|uniref:Nucleotidyl transferase AbiEii/AbiGii toxin family protein n=1 Tax=Sediminicurvatus halobius TaxID=2182432 RepID=A0A2U2MW09_9GAMM|nr:nucleotidyl transferase AbiEii/AbiGii toxin family protein [Spiribacter halobius]